MKGQTNQPLPYRHLPNQAVAGMQDNAEGKEQEEGDEDEDLSPLICIIWDRSSVTEDNLYRLVFAKEIKQL